MMPSPEPQEPPLETADWESWLATLPAEMNTPDESRGLEALLEAHDWQNDSLALDGPTDLTQDVLGARFLNRPDLDANGAISGHTLQYMELVDDGDNRVSGQILDIAHYDDAERAAQVYAMIQSTLVEETLAHEAMRDLAAEMARAHELPDNDWREATPDDHARYLEQNPTLDEASRDLPTDDLLGDPAFSGTLFRETAADPLVNEQALAALKGIGLAVQTDFDLARDSFYDPTHNERLINGIFQQDPADASQNCRPMLIALTAPENGIGFSAQAMEFGRHGSLQDVQGDHEWVQTALEQGGLDSGIAVVEGLEAERDAPDGHSPSWEIS